MMKFILIVVLLIITQLEAKGLGMVNPSQFQCSVAIEVSPLTFSFVKRSLSVRIRFLSNCIRLRDFVFEAFFSLNRRMTIQKHPKIVVLKMFGNKYKLRFSKRVFTGGKSVLRKYKYTRVTLSPSKRPSAKNVDCEMFNRLMLDEKRVGSFGIRRLNKLLYENNPVICSVSRKLKSIFCELD